MKRSDDPTERWHVGVHAEVDVVGLANVPIRRQGHRVDHDGVDFVPTQNLSNLLGRFEVGIGVNHSADSPGPA